MSAYLGNKIVSLISEEVNPEASKQWPATRSFCPLGHDHLDNFKNSVYSDWLKEKILASDWCSVVATSVRCYDISQVGGHQRE